jgi:hypothetical protein
MSEWVIPWMTSRCGFLKDPLLEDPFLEDLSRVQGARKKKVDITLTSVSGAWAVSPLLERGGS